MAAPAELLKLEKQFWNGNADFYRRHVAAECLTVFSEKMAGVLDREKIAGTAQDGGRWKDVAIEEKGFVEPSDGVAILTYRADAHRKDGEFYQALVSSGYVKEKGGWKLMFHQQTPLTAKT
jgi:hypothetical protein